MAASYPTLEDSVTLSYFVYRRSVPGEPVDMTAPLQFYPPHGSDALFDALRDAFPHLKTHSERVRDAIINFLLEERQADQLSQISSTPASGTSPVLPDFTSSSSSFGTPDMPFFETPVATSEHSYTPSASFFPQDSFNTAPLLTPPSLEEMTGVFSLTATPQPKERIRRRMTDAEREEYRKRRMVKACEKCSKRKRKCIHRQDEMRTVEIGTEDRKSKIAKTVRSGASKPVAIQPRPILNQHPNQSLELDLEQFFDLESFIDCDLIDELPQDEPWVPSRPQLPYPQHGQQSLSHRNMNAWTATGIENSDSNSLSVTSAVGDPTAPARPAREPNQHFLHRIDSLTESMNTGRLRSLATNLATTDYAGMNSITDSSAQSSPTARGDTVASTSTIQERMPGRVQSAATSSSSENPVRSCLGSDEQHTDARTTHAIGQEAPSNESLNTSPLATTRMSTKSSNGRELPMSVTSHLREIVQKDTHNDMQGDSRRTLGDSIMQNQDPSAERFRLRRRISTATPNIAALEANSSRSLAEGKLMTGLQLESRGKTTRTQVTTAPEPATLLQSLSTSDSASVYTVSASRGSSGASLQQVSTTSTADQHVTAQTVNNSAPAVSAETRATNAAVNNSVAVPAQTKSSAGPVLAGSSALDTYADRLSDHVRYRDHHGRPALALPHQLPRRDLQVSGHAGAAFANDRGRTQDEIQDGISASGSAVFGSAALHHTAVLPPLSTVLLASCWLGSLRDSPLAGLLQTNLVPTACGSGLASRPVKTARVRNGPMDAHLMSARAMPVC